MSNQIRKIQNEVLAVTEGYRVNKTLGGILEDLENVTAAYKAPRPGEESRSMYEKDLTASVDALTRLIKYNAANRTRPLSNKHDINNLVKTSSNLLEVSNLQAWKTALKVKDNLAYQMVSALDVYGHHSANKSRDIHINADNVVLIAVKVSSNSSAATKGLQMTHGQSSLDLPSTLFSQTNNTVTIVSVIFSTLGKVLTSTEALKKLNSSHSNSSDWFLNSRLASITVRPRLPDVINPPFKLALETNKVTIAGSKRICVFLNLSSEYNKGWSTEGCSVVSSRTNSTTTTCACDHMTLFAVLMDASGDTTGDASHRTALSWISIVGCMLSLIGILVTLLVMFCFWKKLRSPRTVVLVNLCVAIGVTNMLIVAMEIADLQNQTGCTVLAVLLHFFLLSIFCWMLSEGVQLYFSLVKVIGAAADPHIKLFYCLGWGLPTLIVAVSLAATQGRGYANMQTCWLSTRNHVLWAFVAPALLIVSGNVVVFALVIYNMLSSHRLRKESLTRRCQRGLKASFVLLPVLGISWSFGVLTMTSNKIIFNYIFAIFNSLQGFLVFVFHCVFNKQIRDVLNERKRKQAGFATDAMTAHSNRKLSTTTNTTQGTNSRLSLATPLRILNLQMFRSEISPSPHPSPTPSRTRAFEETSIVSASPITPRVERDNLLRGNRAEKREENQESSDYVKDEVKTRESSSPNKPSNNMCDMDERDWTSLESSSVSIVDCSGDEELMETRTNRSVKC